MYIYSHVTPRVCMNVCMQGCVYIILCKYACIYVCIFICLHVFMHVCGLNKHVDRNMYLCIYPNPFNGNLRTREAEHFKISPLYVDISSLRSYSLLTVCL